MRNKLLIATLVLIGLASVAYAAFSQTLTINGSGTAAGTWDVEITSITLTDSYGMTENSAPVVAGDNLSATFDVDLAAPGSFAEYDVVITNSGSIQAKFDSTTDLTALNAAAPDYIFYTVTTPAASDPIAPAATDTMVVRVEWDATETVPGTGTESKAATIDFDYSQDT